MLLQGVDGLIPPRCGGTGESGYRHPRVMFGREKGVWLLCMVFVRWSSNRVGKVMTKVGWSEVK